MKCPTCGTRVQCPEATGVVIADDVSGELVTDQSFDVLTADGVRRMRLRVARGVMPRETSNGEAQG